MQLNTDSYLTIAAPVTGEFRDRGSKFIAYAFPVHSEEECLERLESVRKEHPKARHHCYAYRLGLSKDLYRANDDGEPSGTAGRPILGQIDSFGLTNLLVVVVRYFGGTLLGTSGLIHAYKTSAMDALQKARVVERIIEEVFQLTFSYELMPFLMQAVKKLELTILCQEFGLEGMLEVAIRRGQVKDTLSMLRALIARVSLEEAETIGEIEGLNITSMYIR